MDRIFTMINNNDEKINYVLSDDPDFDVVRLKNTDGSPLIQIYNKLTRSY